MKPGEVGVFIETAHPAKFKDTVEAIIGDEVKIPAKLKAFMKGKKQTVKMSNGFTAFKKYLMKV
jgi:threonine synthase